MKGQVSVVCGTARKSQVCPLCEQEQDIIVRGLAQTGRKNEMMEFPDKGYSFCNCRNIFFTDWSNIEQDIYDCDYTQKYMTEEAAKCIRSMCERYLPKFVGTEGKLFTDIGCANSVVLDYAKEKGWDTFGIDINEHTEAALKHKFLCGSIEDWDIELEMPSSDVFWMSHVIEHLHYPIETMKNIFKKTNKGGYLFVAMPDPWFIGWDKPHEWGHWVVREHHIMWDMESFIEVLEEIGYEFVECFRNQADFFCTGDFHIVMRKP